MEESLETLLSPIKNPNYRKSLLETIGESFNLFIEECADPFFVHDIQGNIIEVNSRACASLGYTRAELLNLTVKDIETGFDANALATVWTSLLPGQTHSLAGRHTRKDGSSFPIEVRLAKMQANNSKLVVAVVRDCSERYQKEKELKLLNEDLNRSLAAERKLTERLTMRFVLTNVLAESKSIAEAAPKFLTHISQQDEWDFVYLCALDENGQFIYEKHAKSAQNQSLERLEEMLKPLVHLKEYSVLNSTWSTGVAQWIENVEKSDGIDARHVKEHQMRTLVTIPIMDNEKVLGIICLVSRQKRSESAEILNFYTSIGSQIGQFIDRTKALAAAREVPLMRQRDDFMAMLTHDLKTPLLGANRILELLTTDAAGPLSTSQRDILKQLQVSNNELVTMVQNLISVYRYERELAQVKFTATNLCAIVNDCIKSAEPLARSKEISIERQIPETPLIVDLDAASIKRATKNLLDNAIKFTPKNGRLSVLVEAVNAGECIIEVSDTGVGLSEEERISLFTRFWQGVLGKKYTAGVGLGLYLCKQITSAHNGTIHCKSKVDEGSVFTIKLPTRQIRRL